ncbi:MAG: amidohydrolase family protein [Acidimicrobiia bacterium]
MSTASALDGAALGGLRGRMLDLDSHIQFPWTELGPLFGPMAGQIGIERDRRGLGAIQEVVGHGLVEDRPDGVDAQSVWMVKGPHAIGANSPLKRLEVLDLMGIDRQLIFPMVLVAIAGWQDTDDGRDAMRRYNDFVLDWARPDTRRLRPTTVLSMGDPALTLAEAERVIAGGARAVLVPCDRPPAGLSPADPAWEPLWALLAGTGVALLFHIGGHLGFLRRGWMPSALAPSPLPGNPGEAAGPFELSTAHLAVQTYLTAMILGGVLERHETLAIGAIELSAHWVGPLAELLDQRVELFGKRMSRLLSLRPSEYLSRQVRVTPTIGEPVDQFIERFGLEDVYAFSTDFPHPEGGTQPITDMLTRVTRLGPATIEKLFVTNAELILPN